MTDHDTEQKPAEEKDVCPHCGAVLDVARAMEKERSVLRARPRADAPPSPAGPADQDPGVA